MRSHHASPVFTLVVFVSLAWFGFLGLMLFGGLLGLDTIAAMGHFTSLHHRIHDLTYSFLFGTAAVGMVAQCRQPSKNVAGMLMALIPWAGFVLASALVTNLLSLLQPPFVPMFGALTLLAIMLHPAGHDLFGSFRVSRVNRVLLVLVAIASISLLAFAAINIGLQRAYADDHAAMGHYMYMVAFSFTVIGVGFLASLQLDGWRLAAWVAGLLPILLGVASLVFPSVSSGLGPVWALLAIAWGIAFVAVAELIYRGSPANGSDETAMELKRASMANMPRWLSVFGVVALVPILLVFVHMVIRVLGGSGTHIPPVQHGP